MFARNILSAAIALAFAAHPALAAPTASDQPSQQRSENEQALPLVQVEGEATANSPVDGYAAKRTATATKTDTPLRDVPQAVTVVTQEAIKDQGMRGMADVVRYVPGMTMAQGEGNRDQVTIRGQNTTADFFSDGIRDDTQYFRDLYNVDRVEALKGPNAMVFGRGGGGGVINRVTKEAGWTPIRELTLQGGSFDAKRAAVDVGQAVNDVAAFRLNGMYENSGTYRDYVDLERFGINPTVTLAPSAQTTIKLGYEYFHDKRTADRGISSFRGAPVNTDLSTFFGNPDLSTSDATVNTFSALVEHKTDAGLTIRNRTRYADYDKFYQNVFPGAVDGTGTSVSISAYNNDTQRQNLFNQTDLIYSFQTGSVKHTLLGGLELGRQKTSNYRETGRFPTNGNATSISAPLSNPTIFVPVTFQNNGTSDANNNATNDTVAVYVQDQIELSPQWQVIAGLRFDRFTTDFHNNQNGQDLSRDDNLVSPRLGLVYKPIEPLSLYASYSVSYLPSSGDQFSSLTATSATLEPEEFKNYELGAKWGVRPDLSLTAAVYQLDRTNTTAPDPNNSAITVQTGSQRSEGFELGLNGHVTSAWQVMGGYAYQSALITSKTSAAAEGATVPLVPRHTLSLWNKYQFTPAWGAGVGVIHQTKMYAAVDNTVTLPSFTRVDGAMYWTLDKNLSAQLNLVNLFDREYFETAHSNTNITPASPRAAYLTVTASY